MNMDGYHLKICRLMIVLCSPKIRVKDLLMKPNTFILDNFTPNLVMIKITGIILQE